MKHILFATTMRTELLHNIFVNGFLAYKKDLGSKADKLKNFNWELAFDFIDLYLEQCYRKQRMELLKY
jgi:hypothetical protein